jgi:hypothetical protein
MSSQPAYDKEIYHNYFNYYNTENKFIDKLNIIDKNIFIVNNTLGSEMSVILPTPIQIIDVFNNTTLDFGDFTDSEDYE